MIYAVLAKPSFEPISSNHLGSNKLHAEQDGDAGASGQKAREQRETSAAATEPAPKAGGNKYERLILSRGLDPPSKKYFDDGSIAKIGVWSETRTTIGGT